MHYDREIYSAVGELAYVITKADGLQSEERREFIELIEEELGSNGLAATSRFELLDEITNPTLEEAYNAAMMKLRQVKVQVDEPIKNKILEILKKVALSYKGINQVEEFVLGRIKQDLKRL
jgi:tetrahydrodipicolinate N-succinyltransferase